MYRRGAMHILVLILVVLVGSAVAQQLTGTQLYVSGNGPHAVGGDMMPLDQLVLTGTYGSPNSGSLVALHVASKLNPAPGNEGIGVRIGDGFTVNKAATGTHWDFASLWLDPPSIGAGAAALRNASTLKIAGAPSGGTNNYALWVATGPTQLSGTLHVVGDAQFDGNIAAKYQDVAEWVPSAQSLAAGTVAVIDGRANNRVDMSTKPYDTQVAGVVSTQPGVLLGEGGIDKTKLAHSGRVKVKVDAQYGAIAIGDLLVTSATPGHAMRSKPMKIGGAEIHRPGTLIGKALEPMEKGRGEILVLLTLQ